MTLLCAGRALGPGDPGPHTSPPGHCVTWSRWLTLSALSIPKYNMGLMMPTSQGHCEK